MFYPEVDDKNNLKERLKELFESHNFATGKMDKTAHYNPETKQIECGRIARKIGGEFKKPDQLTYCIDVDDSHIDHIFLICFFKEQETGNFLVSYEITTNFCKGKYRSAPLTNGHITITELIQDLEDAGILTELPAGMMLLRRHTLDGHKRRGTACRKKQNYAERREQQLLRKAFPLHLTPSGSSR